MSDWFTVITTARALHVPAKSGKLRGFPLFFSRTVVRTAQTVRTLICICRAGNNLSAVHLPFGVLFRFSSPDRVFVMTPKSQGCRARALKSNVLAQFSSPPLTGAIRMIQLNSARFSRISRRLIFFRGSPWASRGNREPRWTTHLLRGGSESDPL